MKSFSTFIVKVTYINKAVNYTKVNYLKLRFPLSN